MAEFVITCLPWLLSFIVGIVTSFYLYVKWLYRYFDKRGLPYDTPTFPFGSLAPAFRIKRSYSETLAEIYARHKDLKIVGFFSLWTKQFLIRDHELLKTILIKDFHIFQDRGVYYNKEKDPISAHLFSLDGEAWKTLRAKLTPTFTSGKLKGMHDTILSCTNLLSKSMVAHVFKKVPFDCQDVFLKFTQTVIGITAFGIESDCLFEEKSKFSECVGAMTKASFSRQVVILLMMNRQLAKLLNICVIPEITSRFIRGLIKDTVGFREKNGVTRNDYLQILMELKNSKDQESQVKLTEDEMAAQAFVLIVAGSETNASAMTFCLYELSKHPEIQARLHQELDDLPDLSYDSLNNTVYLDMVISETLRKHPPVGFLSRECSQDYKVPGTDVVIEKGTQIQVPVLGIHTDPELFPDPELFNPERFSKENKDLIKPFTYMPFGEGPRHCIGKRFGLLVVKAALVAILKRFKVTLEDDKEDSLKVDPRGIIRIVHNGLRLRFEERSQEN